MRPVFSYALLNTMSKKIVEDNDWSKIVGQPDQWDKENIQALVNTFSKTTFTIPIGDEEDSPTITITGAQWIKQGLEEARERHQITGSLKGNEYGLKDKQTDTRVMTTIPKPLQMKIMEGYPTLLKDKKHLMWFCKNFPQFRVPIKL